MALVASFTAPLVALPNSRNPTQKPTGYVALLKDGQLDLEELARMTALGGR